MPNRIEKINDFIRDSLSLIITKDISLKQGVFVSIIKVDTSRDLRYAKVFVSIFPETETDYALKTLQNEIFRIQKGFNAKFNAAKFPKISFTVDSTGGKITELDELFDQIAREK